MILNFVAIELEGSEADAMDLLYYSNKSLKKKIDFLNQENLEYLPDQLTYFVCLVLSDFLDIDEPNYNSIDKVLKSIEFNTIRYDVLTALLKYLKTTCHLYKEYNTFYKNCITYFEKIGLDSELILADI